MAKPTQRILGVIPARLASTRLPEKPLRLIAGKSLIQRVWDQARCVRSFTELVVATDSDRIAALVSGFGGTVAMTDPALSTGSERVRAAALQLGSGQQKFDIIVNVQGDMPFIPPAVIDNAVEHLQANAEKFDMVTVATPLVAEDQFRSNSVVKVAVGDGGQGLYFSRAPIPFSRDGDLVLSDQGDGQKGAPVFGYKHFGLYVFGRRSIEAYANSDQTPLERVEKLEQLRLLERGYRVGVLIVNPRLVENCVEIDTPADLERAEAILKLETSSPS